MQISKTCPAELILQNHPKVISFKKIISLQSNLFFKNPIGFFFLFKRCDDRDSVMATSIKLSWPTQNTFPMPLYHSP